MRPKTVYSAREGQRFNTDTTLAVVTCPECSVVYAIPESFNKSAIAYPGGSANGWDICCPFGHTWHYVGQSVADKLATARDEAARLTAELDQTKASLTGTRTNAARTRKDLKQLKGRVAHGVCPCCNRTFKQLEAHMKNKHPEFVAQQEAGA